MKTASIGVNKTTLVPTLSHSTRGGQEGEALPFVVTSRCSTVFPLPESGSCTLSSAHKVTRRHGRRFSSPQLSIQVRQQKSGGVVVGGRNIQTNKQEKREMQRLVPIQPGQRRNPRLDIHRESWRMNRHVKYMFLYQSAKSFFSSGHTGTLMRHQ